MAQFSKSLFESIKGFGDPISPTDKQEDSKYIQRGTTDRTARRVGGLMEALGMNADYMKTGQERAVAAGQRQLLVLVG